MNIKLIVAAVFVVGFAALGISDITTKNDKIQLKAIELKSKSTELKTLELKYDHLEVELDKADKTNKEQIQKLETDKQHLEQERQRLEKEVAVKKQNKAVAAGRLNNAAVAATGTAHASAQGNTAKMFIYMHESGNNPAAVNSIGCRGLGQACPGSKLPCGNDYACQDAYFTNYAMQRYGSWEAAYSFWLSHRWW